MWTDLDQAYLEIFGTHPEVAHLPPPAADEDAPNCGGQVRDDE